MKAFLFKAAASVSLTALSAYFNALFTPVAVLIFFMLADYVTGMVKAWETASLSSRVGVVGIVKKLCYLFAVCAGAGADYVLSLMGENNDFVCPVACMVAVWLIINEMISILENLQCVGVPLPDFLLRLTKKLMNSSDKEK